MKRIKSYKFNNKGFTFMEVIVAVFIISVGVVGVIKVMPSIISDSSVNNARLTAAYLAQEGIEIVRNIRDSNLLEGAAWDEGLNPACNAGCIVDYINPSQQDPSLVLYSGQYLQITAGGFYGYSGTLTKFQRKITIVQEDANTLKITVDINWQERNKNYSFTAQEKLYNWY
jgi:prepilin-type N-terminal cleavage/methylation domain-containing protein